MAIAWFGGFYTSTSEKKIPSFQLKPVIESY